MRLDEKFEFLIKKHIIFCLMGLIIIFTFSRLSIKNVILYLHYTFIICIFLSISTIFFFPETKGASRWIILFNFSFQPTEILKPTFVILSSLLLGRYKSKRDFFFYFKYYTFWFNFFNSP